MIGIYLKGKRETLKITSYNFEEESMLIGNRFEPTSLGVYALKPKEIEIVQNALKYEYQYDSLGNLVGIIDIKYTSINPNTLFEEE